MRLAARSRRAAATTRPISSSFVLGIACVQPSQQLTGPTSKLHHGIQWYMHGLFDQDCGGGPSGRLTGRVHTRVSEEMILMEHEKYTFTPR